MKLQLQINSKIIKDPCEGQGIMITPPISDKDYWICRVNLFEDQYVKAFPKFGTIGIGFYLEVDWNTNLPYTCDSEEIRQHIWHNRRYIAIGRKRTIRAIKMLQEFIKSKEETK
jgi:hypothetical protein